MRIFFAELNQEAISKKKKGAKKIKKTQKESANISEMNPEIAQSSSFDITEDELEPITPSPTEIVIETPPTTPSPIVQPTVSADVQKRPIKIASQKPVNPHITAAPALYNNEYLILIGQNLKWPQLNKNQQQLIKDNLLSLKNWPTHKLDIKQLKGEVNMFRLRVGNYRIIFSVDTIHREIKVQKIGLRKEIYKQYKS